MAAVSGVALSVLNGVWAEEVDPDDDVMIVKGGEKGDLTDTAGEAPSTKFLLVEGVPAGAPGRIRTGATGSGGRCSIP